MLRLGLAREEGGADGILTLALTAGLDLFDFFTLASGLDLSVTKEELTELFSQFGKLADVRLVTYRNGHSKVRTCPFSPQCNFSSS